MKAPDYTPSQSLSPPLVSFSSNPLPRTAALSELMQTRRGRREAGHKGETRSKAISMCVWMNQHINMYVRVLFAIITQNASDLTLDRLKCIHIFVANLV